MDFPTENDVSSDAPEATETEEVVNSTESPHIAQIPSEFQFAEARKVVPVAELLNYIRSTFDDESVLDSLPVEVAGNPGAWHAWKAHRRGTDSSRNWKKGSPQARQPGDWHWDGIWARRVHDEIEASHSDPMLFGGATRGGGDEMIRFSRLDDATMSSVKEKMDTDSPDLRGSHGGVVAEIVGGNKRGFDLIWEVLWEIERLKSPTERSSMDRPSLVSSMSRGFATEGPEPLTVKRCSVSRSHSTSSSSSYPEIPGRSSSLIGSMSDGSCGPVSSTRTPSLSDSLYRIEVVKPRQHGLHPRRDINSSELYSMDDPLPGPPPKHRGTGRSIHNWSSYCAELKPAASELQRSLSNSETSYSSNFLHPMDLPISVVNVRAAANRTHIGKEATSLWTTVTVSADVSPTPFPGTSSVAPLDIVILLDALRQPSVDLITQTTLGSYILASHLTYNHDRIALAYVGGKANQGFQMLLPLGFYPIEAIRSALNTFSRRQLIDNEACLNLGDVFQRASNIFSHSPRAAFCHLFFVSATPPGHLLVPWIDQAIGFHTITPHACLPLDNNKSLAGWHISYTVGESDTGPRETHFIRRIARVVRQLRTGIRTGCISDLKISIVSAPGCQIQSLFENITLMSLRPGETWSIPVQIRVPGAFRQSSQIAQNAPSQQHPLINEMMSRINFLLQDFSSDEITQPLLTAHVSYQHSFLPAPSTIHVDTHLTVIRRKETELSAPRGCVKVSMASSAQDSDFSPSLSS
ncbi:Ubiquitin-conjugating enzyme E2 [Penicillium pulvis]|uniref:Ubiquitin-conjugating enzyme E2 n=1 Tax=Penicillium pulvis TaxID=1562058 RepID=UPI0025465DCF|nr:Ubiquitin-conjugating enzyme E2 [Penicillium pulvis]KAJ5786742.1 Ubiquitin-conjugating enzyme E2 [Penicillium pulvis]